MTHKIQKQVKAYFDKARACNTLVRAPLIQPGLCLHFLYEAFAEFDSCTCSLLNSAFHEIMAILDQSEAHVTKQAGLALTTRMSNTETQEDCLLLVL